MTATPLRICEEDLHESFERLVDFYKSDHLLTISKTCALVNYHATEIEME